MRTKIFLLFFLLATVKGFSQADDLYQLPSVFKQNHVKLRITRTYPLTLIDHFDKEGLLTERVYSDSAGKSYKCSIQYVYDSAQNLLTETAYISSHRDSTGKESNDWIKDTLYVKVEHDNRNRISKITYSDKSGKSKTENSFSYEPYIETKTGYNKSGKNCDIITEFEKPFVKKKVSNINYLPNGEKGNSCYMEFKNKYDKSGKIIKQKIKTTFDSFDSFHDYTTWYSVKYEYIYADNGLLISFINTLGNGSKGRQEFKYEFW